MCARRAAQDLLDAQEGFTPLALKGVPLQKSCTNWADIGGLDDVKALLKETLEWPTRYEPLFRNVPLRLRSGLLLYGPPGCGKTLLASAVAKETGLNFISIKGPELLSKYIGASEQGVSFLLAVATFSTHCI
jgi:peroxin-1